MKHANVFQLLKCQLFRRYNHLEEKRLDRGLKKRKEHEK